MSTKINNSKYQLVVPSNEARSNGVESKSNKIQHEQKEYGNDMRSWLNNDACAFSAKSFALFAISGSLTVRCGGTVPDPDAVKDLFTNVLFSINNPIDGDLESLAMSLDISAKNYADIGMCDKVVCDQICDRICDGVCDGIVCDVICDGIICDGIICDAICDKIF